MQQKEYFQHQHVQHPFGSACGIIEIMVNTENGNVFSLFFFARIRVKPGSEFPLELTVARVRGDARGGTTGFIRDITERRLLEEQLRQSQKLEAIGRLASGVASGPLGSSGCRAYAWVRLQRPLLRCGSRPPTDSWPALTACLTSRVGSWGCAVTHLWGVTRCSRMRG